MTQFIQIHTLTSYSASCLNRDDLNRPKTVRMGGVDRLRISSQCIKRAWRTSDCFQSELEGQIGARSRRFILDRVYAPLIAAGVEKEQAFQWSKTFISAFQKEKKAEERGKKKSKRQDDEDEETTQETFEMGEAADQSPSAKKGEGLEPLALPVLVHLSAQEISAIDQIVKKMVAEKRGPQQAELDSIFFEKKGVRHSKTAVDISLFGRMLAANAELNFEAACQVAHPISVHGVAIEDDYFTAVDDLNIGKDHVGAGHLGEAGFGAAVFYSYLCINKDLLIENLGGDVDLANKALAALLEAVVKVSPGGKQSSYASRAYASFVLAEVGQEQPRSLSVAFLDPITGTDQGARAASRLVSTYENFDKVYGLGSVRRMSYDAFKGQGSLKALSEFVLGGGDHL